MKFFVKDFFAANVTFGQHLVTFIEEIYNGKLHFLRSDSCLWSCYDNKALN